MGAAHHQPASLHPGSRAPLEHQADRGAHGRHGDHPWIGQGGPVGGPQKAALQHPAEIAVGIAQVFAALLQSTDTGAAPTQLQDRGGPPGMADRHHPVGADPLQAIDAACGDRIDGG